MQAQAYLDSLGERQRRELSGVRDRLSILAESDVRDWLHPAGGNTVLDIHQALTSRAVVYFRLDADRRPLLAPMIAAALIGDLVSLVARLQTRPLPTVVVIDEFSALAADEVARLFARGRSAGVNLILGTQELADLKNTGEGALRQQTLGNVETVIAHRQNVPESAELIAAMAGTRPAWVTTQQTDEGLIGTGPSGRGTGGRGYEFEIHPSHIKQLSTGKAVVITPSLARPPRPRSSTTHATPVKAVVTATGRCCAGVYCSDKGCVCWCNARRLWGRSTEAGLIVTPSLPTSPAGLDAAAGEADRPALTLRPPGSSRTSRARPGGPQAKPLSLRPARSWQPCARWPIEQASAAPKVVLPRALARNQRQEP